RWLQHFLHYLTTMLGTKITIRVNVYYAGCLHFCVDFYDENNASFVTTIALSSDTIRLFPPIDNQLDIVLPGIADVFHLIRQVLAYIRQESGRISFLEISLPADTQGVKPHVPMS
ncbi:MAG: hypothetical protein ACRCWR_13280, partial [Saezia sp.]